MSNGKDIWEDIVNFKFLTEDEMSQQSVYNLSVKMMDMANHLAFVSQFEPELKKAENEIKMQIEIKDKKLTAEISARLERNFDIIPALKRKNKELMLGWLHNHDDYIKNAIDEIDELKKKLVTASYNYDRFYRRIQTARFNLDVGRSILSALKVELGFSQ